MKRADTDTQLNYLDVIMTRDFTPNDILEEYLLKFLYLFYLKKNVFFETFQLAAIIPWLSVR